MPIRSPNPRPIIAASGSPGLPQCRGRSTCLLSLVLVLALGLTMAACDKTPKSRERPADDALIDVPVAGREGRLSDLTDLSRGRAVVLNVWATWCAPCRAELPSLQRLSDQLDPDRYAVIGLSIDHDPDFVAEYLRDIGITFANLVATDPAGASAELGAKSLPQTLLLRPDGSLHQKVVGARDWTAPNERASVLALYPPRQDTIRYGDGVEKVP